LFDYIFLPPIRCTVSHNTDTCYTINNHELVNEIGPTVKFTSGINTNVGFDDVNICIIFSTALLLRVGIRLYIYLQFSTGGRKWNIFRQSANSRKL